MNDPIDLSNKMVSDSDAMNRVVKAQAELAKARAEVSALRKDRDDALSEYNALRAAKFPVKRDYKPRPKVKTDTVRLIANDVHGSMMDREAVEAFLGDVRRLSPDEIVLNGDIVECGGFLAKHHTANYIAQTTYTYQDDIAHGNWFLDQLQDAAPSAQIHFIEGNHECLHPSHEVLTDRGWKKIPDVAEADTVASIDPLGKVVWGKPKAIVSYPFDGEMVVLQSRCADAVMTPNHRVAHFGQYQGDLKYRRADSISGKSVAILPTAGKSDMPDFEGVSDDEIRLVAWILTDGHIGGHVGISQSKPETIPVIQDLLDRLELRYAKRTRDRDARDICGVALKSMRQSVTFDLSSESGRDVARLFGIKQWSHSTKYEKAIPEWVGLLSERQFDLFLDTLILGDGSNSSTGHQSRCLYGKRGFLSEIQSLCVVNGHRASLAQRNRNGQPDYWVLNLTKRDRTKTEGANYGRRAYAGLVHCLTMATGNFFTRLNGKVHVTGNCRVERWITDETLSNSRDSEFLYKLNAPEFLLKLKERGVIYYRRSESHVPGLPPGWIKLGKIFFVHELSGGKHAASDSVSRTAGNVVFAHTHREDTATRVLPGVGLVKAWNPGCLCQRQPLWRHSDPTGWSHGYAYQIIAKSGEFMHVNVPIWEGRSLLGNMLETK